MSMRKKMMDQKTDPVIVAMASGYTIKTRPGPGSKINDINYTYHDTDATVSDHYHLPSRPTSATLLF